MVEVVSLIVAVVASVLGFGEYQRRKGRKEVVDKVTQDSLQEQNQALQVRLQREQAGKQEAADIATQVAKDVDAIEEEGATQVANLTPDTAVDFISRGQGVDREH